MPKNESNSNTLDTLSAEELKLRIIELENTLKANHSSLESANTKAKQAKTELHNTQKTVLLREAARNAGIADIEAFVKIATKDFRYDETRKSFIVPRPGGGYALNNRLEPLSPLDYAQEFVQERPYWAAQSSIPGKNVVGRSGTSHQEEEPLTNYFGKKSSGAKANALKKSDPRRYNELRAKAVEEGLIG